MWSFYCAVIPSAVTESFSHELKKNILKVDFPVCFDSFSPLLPIATYFSPDEGYDCMKCCLTKYRQVI